MSKRNICDIHKEIKDYAWDIQKIKSQQYETVEDLLSEVQWIADQIEDAADEALEAGKSMENRLIEYRCAIEDLGYKRVR